MFNLAIDLFLVFMGMLAVGTVSMLFAGRLVNKLLNSESAGFISDEDEAALFAAKDLKGDKNDRI